MTGRLALLAALVGTALMVSLPGSAPGKRVPLGCDGVVMPLEPLIVTGEGEVVVETTGPADDAVQCVSEVAPPPPPLEPPAPRKRRGGCANARVEAVGLSGRLAAKAVRCLINRVRVNRGLNSLHSNRKLAKAARRHTAHMLANGCFSHQCSGEPDLTGRVTGAGYLPCTCTWTVAENLAWGKRSHSTPAAIVRAWMNSPPHRDTLLRSDLREVGVAMKKGIPGNSGARGGTYTANFGTKA